MMILLRKKKLIPTTNVRNIHHIFKQLIKGVRYNPAHLLSTFYHKTCFK